MPRKVKCSSCDKICHAKVQPYKCIACKPKQTKQEKRQYKKFFQTKKKYNIDALDYYCLWIAFKGKCCICDINLSENKNKRGQCLTSVCIDHDHKTGNVRGLLCSACNKAIGLIKDDPLIALKMKEYLSDTKTSISSQNP